jgi:hypothetical protein
VDPEKSPEMVHVKLDGIFQQALPLTTVDVGITLRVTNVMLPPTAQPGAHEDHPPTKVGHYVGFKKDS